MVINVHINILVKDVRKNKKLTLAQLSKKSGVSTTHINGVENQLREPSLLVMVRLAKALDVDIKELYKVIW